jgi:hypothetical protein
MAILRCQSRWKTVTSLSSVTVTAAAAGPAGVPATVPGLDSRGDSGCAIPSPGPLAPESPAAAAETPGPGQQPTGSGSGWPPGPSELDLRTMPRAAAAAGAPQLPKFQARSRTMMTMTMMITDSRLIWP